MHSLLRQLFQFATKANFLSLHYLKDGSSYYCCISFTNTTMTYRNSRPEVLCKKGALKNFAKFTGKHLCQSLFLNKVAGLSLPKQKIVQIFFQINLVSGLDFIIPWKSAFNFFSWIQKRCFRSSSNFFHMFHKNPYTIF